MKTTKEILIKESTNGIKHLIIDGHFACIRAVGEQYGWFTVTNTNLVTCKNCLKWFKKVLE